LARRIAKKRAPKSAAEYAKIGFSPINRMTSAQASHLESALRQIRPNTKVVVVNRYTAPTSEEVVKDLDFFGSRIFMVTLYPHLCHSTTVSSLRDFDLAVEAHLGHRNIPTTRVFSWWQTPRYLDHTYARLQAGLEPLVKDQSSEPVTVLFSAHGIPIRYHERGDPYVTETQAHFRELQQRGEVWLKQHYPQANVRWQLSFQSRVGPVEWVKPYTDETITQLAKERGGKILLVPISFTADHIETLYEMDHTYRELALSSGFTKYARVVPSNDDPELAACLVDALRAHGF
jgi:ferrochelatase